jgi:DNA replication protein DnaC
MSTAAARGLDRALFQSLATSQWVRDHNHLALVGSTVMSALESTDLIIIDDWGPEPLTAEQCWDLLEIVDDRYDKGSLLITSQVPVPHWHDVIAAPRSAM